MTTDPTKAVSRSGSLVSAAVNLVLLWLVNGWPGWDAVPFLTSDAAQVVPLVNASLLFGVLGGLAVAALPRPRLRAVVDAISAAFALAVVYRLVRVFPFDFAGAAVDWARWVRLGLWLLVVACAIALITQVVRVLRPGRG